MVPGGKQTRNIMKDGEIHNDGNVWSTAQRRGKVKDLMMMLPLIETIDKFSVAKCEHWKYSMLRREDIHV